MKKFCLEILKAINEKEVFDKTTDINDIRMNVYSIDEKQTQFLGVKYEDNKPSYKKSSALIKNEELKHTKDIKNIIDIVIESINEIP